MKKLGVFILMFVLTVSVIATDTYALSKGPKGLPPGLAKKGFIPPGHLKKFRDIGNYHWAERAIERLASKEIIKGYGDGTFNPSKQVTKLEAITMVLKVMGYEDEAQASLKRIKKDMKKLKNKDKIQEWAYGYVSVAIEKEILDEADIKNFSLLKPATRHEVAKYLIRALGNEEEAQDYMDKKLKFVDSKAVPSDSVGYVYLAVKEGIITGYKDNTFRPNKPVTRAEMAVMIDKLDDQVENVVDKNERYAEIVKIYSNRLKLEINNKIVEYKVLSNVPIYDDSSKYRSLDDLEIGMKIKFQLNDDETIIFIEIKEYEDINELEKYEGEVEEIDEDMVTIDIGNIEITLDMTDDIKVEFKNRDGKLSDIVEGDEVELSVNGEKEVNYIKVDRNLDMWEYEGTVEEIDHNRISIKVDSIGLTFRFANDVTVRFKNKEGRISDIREDDDVKIRIDKYNRVEYVEVDRTISYKEYSGVIDDIDDIDDDEIIIEVSNIEMKFEMDSDVEVKFKNEEGNLDDLRDDDEVRLVLDGDSYVIIIYVNRNL